MQIFSTYSELLARVEQTGRCTRILAHAPDGSPIIAVKAGGDREPAVFITAGSHSTEHAGVSAAVALIEQLDTDHQVYVIPTRDPIGLNGYACALSLGLGEAPEFDSFEEVENILRERGETFYDEDGMVLSLIGDYGFATSRPAEHRPHPQFGFYQQLRKLEKSHPELVQPFVGRRVYMSPGQSDVEGTGNFGRAYTLIVSPLGEVLHLNRFYDTVWAPVEVRCTRRLMAEINPGISFDLHESQLLGDCFGCRPDISRTNTAKPWNSGLPGQLSKPSSIRAPPCPQTIMRHRRGSPVPRKVCTGWTQMSAERA